MRKGDLRYEDFSKVFTRVAYQAIRHDARANPELYAIPCKGTSQLAQRLNDAGFKAMAFWVIAYQLELVAGHSMAEARARMIRRSGRRPSWRHVAFAGYKRNRVP